MAKEMKAGKRKTSEVDEEKALTENAINRVPAEDFSPCSKICYTLRNISQNVRRTRKVRILSCTKVKSRTNDDNSDDPNEVSECDNIYWMGKFLRRRGNEFFTYIDDFYIRDNDNLTGFEDEVTYYEESLQLILDIWTEDEPLKDDNLLEAIELDSQKLYGLIHARYIMTTRGMEQMRLKYMKGDFGQCPRVYCEEQNVLPIGLTDTPEKSMVKLYCPKCKDVYNPRLAIHSKLDGAYFGTGFPHAFFMAHPEFRPPPSSKLLKITDLK